MNLRDLEVFITGTPPPGRALLADRQADDRYRDGRPWRGPGRRGWPQGDGRGDRGRFLTPHAGREPRKHRTDVSPHLFLGFTQRPDPTVIAAFSGLEIACWDRLGKAHKRPAHALPGGRMNDRLRAYTYLHPMAHHGPVAFLSSPEMQADSAIGAVDPGFSAIRLDPAGPYTLRGGHQPSLGDIAPRLRLCPTLREAVGDRADPLIGTQRQFTPAGAIRLGQALEPFRPLWFEEPIPPDTLLDFAQVAQAVRIPSATGQRLTTKAGSPPSPRPSARRLRLLSMPGRWNGRRISNWRSRSPTCCWSNASSKAVRFICR